MMTVAAMSPDVYKRQVPAEELTCPEVANSSSWYDKNGNTIDDLLGGAKPGKDTISGKESSSSAASSSSSSGK